MEARDAHFPLPVRGDDTDLTGRGLLAWSPDRRASSRTTCGTLHLEGCPGGSVFPGAAYGWPGRGHCAPTESVWSGEDLVPPVPVM
jgi:hypothetical protein